MAHPGGTSARAHRLIGLAATGLLAVTTALAFARVFLGTRATVVLLATAIASAAIAVALERRSLLLATVASAAGLAFAIGVAVFPDTTWYGVPTAHTWSVTLHAAGIVGEQARIQVAPAEPIAPLLLAAVVSLWAAIFSAHALAFRAGSPLLGLIPPVALVAFADTVLEQFVKPIYGLTFLAAALLVVFADGLSRVQGWGPVWTSSRRGVAATAGTGARRLAAATLAAGLIAPIVVPGFGSRAVIDFSAAGDDAGVSVDPFVSVQNQLTEGTPRTILSVRGSTPTYLRLLSLPFFDGTGWRHDPNETGQPLGLEGDTGTELDPAAAPVPYQIDVLEDFAMPWVPAPYPTTRIQSDVPVTYDVDTGTALAVERLHSGTTYTAYAVPPNPTADDLRAIADRAGFGRDRLGNDDPYLDVSGVPRDIYARLQAIAQDWTRDADNVFDRAMAIQEQLTSSSFEYDEETNLGSGPTTILSFLTGSRKGFCQQFASSMATLLRILHIPSRVVVGYSTGVTSPTAPQGAWTVRSDSAHAWVEVLFPGVGWMPFEPTPSRSNPIVEGYTRVATDGPGQPDVRPPTPAERSERAGQQGLIDPTPALPGGGTCGPRQGCTDPLPPLPESTPLVSGRRGLALLAGLAALVVLMIPVVRAFRRRVRLRRAAAQPRRLILATYDAFSERIAGVGLARSPGETLEEYRRRVLDTGYLSDGHLDRLTMIASVAAYSNREPDRDDAREATDAANTAVTDIRRAVGPVRWFTGLYRRT
jgi:transglutaminase-like putative cysteine protease